MKRFGVAKMKQTTIIFEDEQHAFLRKKAFEEAKSISELIRELVAKSMCKVNG